MSWKKYFRPVNSALPAPTAYSDPSSSVSNFSSWLPEYYQGPPNRIMRYLQYDQMDMDHEISAALDTLADFSTHLDEDTGVPFEINYSEDASPSEIEVLEKSLRQWCNLNELDRRLFRIFRSVLKYGDQFFIRHPRTYKLHWVDPSTVEKVLVNESQGKKVESFFIKDLDLNLQSLTASNMNRKTQRGYDSADTVFPNVPYTGQVGGGGYGNMSSYGGVDYAEGEAFQVDSTHVVHMTLSEGMTSSWPFGISILETVFKVYKQKELLEDSILIYRIHRAPERRIFYIDTGTMPPNKAAQYLERVRYEVQQKRIPSRTGGGQNITDAAYNPLSSLEDYYFAVSAEGRGSKVETLPGGENLGCFSLDTKVKLMDGRDLSISEISEELKQGEELWTYSCHPVTGEVAPGFISWAGKTRSQADVMKITLDSGDEIVCTPDHNFPIKGVGFVEAKDLSVGESLIPLYIEGDLIYCPHKKTWVSKTTFGTPAQEQEKDVELNHKIAAIEYLEEKLDVGTLTVDITEEYHNYHTYALSVGVFVKNSIDDLRYFNNKMMRALGVPSGYLPTGPEDGTNAYSDGRVGAAFIQEFRFSRVCQRYQRLIAPVFDREFKLFLKHRGIEVDNSIFSISFTPPQNFSEYRKLELDSAYANLYNSVAANENLSRRFALKKYLGLSEAEIAENEKLWREENDVSHLTQDERPGLDMRQADIRAPMDADFDDFDLGDPDIGEPDIGDMDIGDPDIGGDEV